MQRSKQRNPPPLHHFGAIAVPKNWHVAKKQQQGGAAGGSSEAHWRTNIEQKLTSNDHQADKSWHDSCAVTKSYKFIFGRKSTGCYFLPKLHVTKLGFVVIIGGKGGNIYSAAQRSERRLARSNSKGLKPKRAERSSAVVAMQYAAIALDALAAEETGQDALPRRVLRSAMQCHAMPPRLKRGRPSLG